jgi:hypothetical protein
MNEKRKEDAVTDLLIHDLPPELARRIEERARANRRSVSEEAGALLQRALGGREGEKPGLGTWLSQLVAKDDWTDEFIQPRDNSERPPVDFEK